MGHQAVQGGVREIGQFERDYFHALDRSPTLCEFVGGFRVLLALAWMAQSMAIISVCLYLLFDLLPTRSERDEAERERMKPVLLVMAWVSQFVTGIFHAALCMQSLMVRSLRRDNDDWARQQAYGQ